MAETPTPAEARLVAAAAAGTRLDLSAGQPPCAVSEGGTWGPERTIRATVLRALCLGENPDWPVRGPGLFLAGARITGEFDLRAGEVAFPLQLTGCYFEQAPTFRDSRLRTLSLGGSHMPGLKADRMALQGSLLLRDGFTAAGEVRLVAAQISGTLDLTGGQLGNPRGKALNADRARIGGNLLLSAGFEAAGAVHLRGTRIGAQLICTGGRFRCRSSSALNAAQAAVGGSVLLNRDFTAAGGVRLIDCRIQGNLDCRGATLGRPEGEALNMQRARVEGALYLTGLTRRPAGRLDFSHASIGPLVDEPASWPEPGRLVLDGFVYAAIAGGSETGFEARLGWLKLQPAEHLAASFRPQPFEQLAAVLRRMGHLGDAREIAVAKQEMLRKSGRLGPLPAAWNLLLGFTIGHGYKPWRALGLALAVVIFGWCVFASAGLQGLMVPAKDRVYMDPGYRSTRILPEEYSPFQPLAYSLDLFLPIVDLHQEDHWLPKVEDARGAGYRVYFWVHIMLGWLLTSLAVAGLSGIVKKD